MRFAKNFFIGFYSMLITFTTLYINVEASNGLTLSNFDYVRYADTYPDLKQAYGYDAQKLYTHYITLGKPEGRIGMRTKASYLDYSNFDAARYAAENPDVMAAVGSSRNALYKHFKEFGQFEGRQAWSTSTDGNAKLKAYDVVASVTNGSMSETERIRAIHDWIVKNVRYNEVAYNTGNFSDSDYSAEGPLLLGTGVCSGYAEAFALCMDIIGVENRIPYSNDHAWNEVRLADGRLLSIDVCWDDPIPDRGSEVYWYQYFLITPEQMAGVECHNKIGYY